jgi:hypothetical protein
MRLSRLELILAAACVIVGAAAIIVNAIGLAQYLAG